MPSVPLRGALLVLMAAVAVAGCQLLFPTVASDDAGRDAGLADTVTHDARTDSGSPDVVRADDCHALPLPPPAHTSVGAKTVSFVTAIQAFSGITADDAGYPLGFDLDHTCTCEGKPPGPPSCRSPSPNCDDPGGRDLIGDRFAQLFDEHLKTTSQGGFNDRIAAGRFGVVLYVDDYNGKDDDDGVLLGFFISSGIIDPKTGMFLPPKWDGNDAWNIDPSSGSPVPLSDGGVTYTPLAFTTTAYVTQGTLVAYAPNLQLGLGLAPLPLSGVVFSAHITKNTDGTYRLDGQFGSRASTHDLLGVIGHSGYTSADGGIRKLCGEDPLFLTLRQSLCAGADIMANPSLDDQDASCNAVSLATGFTALPARFGTSAPSVYASAGCDGSVVDCTD
jgi:hypothetical protein